MFLVDLGSQAGGAHYLGYLALCKALAPGSIGVISRVTRLEEPLLFDNLA
jgi:hypothetical protein